MGKVQPPGKRRMAADRPVNHSWCRRLWHAFIDGGGRRRGKNKGCDVRSQGIQRVLVVVSYYPGRIVQAGGAARSNDRG